MLQLSWLGLGEILGVMAILALVAWYMVSVARRLHALHLRLLRTRRLLEKLLTARASQALHIAHELDTLPEHHEYAQMLLKASRVALQSFEQVLVPDGLDAIISQSVTDLMDTEANERAVRESHLTRVLRDFPPGITEPALVEQMVELQDTCYKVLVARNQHNVDVGQVRHLREKPWVRALRLYGHAAMPITIDFDDQVTLPVTIPAGFTSIP